MNANNRGIVLCFLIYVVLCATIVSIIEMPWLVVPVGSKVNVNVSELLSNNTAYVTANVTNDNFTWTATMPGYCGVSGYCYPFEDESVIVAMLSGKWGSRCNQINPLDPIMKRYRDNVDSSVEEWNVVRFTPLYAAIKGSLSLLITWIVAICSCCNHECGFCTIYSVLAVMLTYSTTVFLVGGTLLFLYSQDEDSCIQRLCGDVESAFDIGHCVPGWSLYVAAGAIICGYILVVVSCILSCKTPLGRKGRFNQIVEVRPVAGPRVGRGNMRTTRA